VQGKRRRNLRKRTEIPDTVYARLPNINWKHRASMDTKWTREVIEEFIPNWNDEEISLEQIASKYSVSISAVINTADRLRNIAKQPLPKNGEYITTFKGKLSGKVFTECIGVCCVFHENGVRKRRKRWIERGMHMCAKCHGHISQIEGNSMLNETAPA